MWLCLMISNHAPREQNDQTHNISHLPMLLEFASCKVKQLLSSRRWRLCQPLMLGRGDSERSKNLDRTQHTVHSANNVSPQRQDPAPLQELQQLVVRKKKKVCPDLWRFRKEKVPTCSSVSGGPFLPRSDDLAGAIVA